MCSVTDTLGKKGVAAAKFMALISCSSFGGTLNFLRNVHLRAHLSVYLLAGTEHQDQGNNRPTRRERTKMTPTNRQSLTEGCVCVLLMYVSVRVRVRACGTS